jgi:uncharacterized protein (TIGR02466 family)
MHNDHEIIELFPTPVYATRLPERLSSVISFFDNQKLNEEADEDNYGQHSKDTYILDHPECKDLSSFILQEVYKFGSDILGYDYDSYKFSQSWVSYKQPGQHHSAHTHPNSLISGVFYYGPIQPNTPAINFHKSVGGLNASYIKPKVKLKVSKYLETNSAFNVEPGLMILFPSHLMHSVPVNKTDVVRCSLAFNVVPTIGFGDVRELTELKF